MQILEINIPASKSITQRALICASLSNGLCKIKNPLYSEDTLLLINALKNLNINLKKKENEVQVFGNSGEFQDNGAKEIYMGNNGTGFRFLIALSGFYTNIVKLTGNERMHQRPIGSLVHSLKKIGYEISYLNKEGFPPIKIFPVKEILQNSIEINASESSQFVSSLLLSSPLFKKDFLIKLQGEAVSYPYIELTINIMKYFGIDIIDNKISFYVKKGEKYRAKDFTVENDFSSASYFFAASIIKDIPIRINNLFFNNSFQGDKNFLDIIMKMGANVEINDNSVTVYGGNLKGIEIDMKDTPDVVPTLSVLAAFAKGDTIIKNIAHLRLKESDRIEVVVKNLKKLGINIISGYDFIKISPKKRLFLDAIIDPANDHRMAMSFALFSLINKNIKILNKECVNKSFPNFWEEFNKIISQ